MKKNQKKKKKDQEKKKKKQKRVNLMAANGLHFINIPNHDDTFEPAAVDGDVKIPISGFAASAEGFPLPTITITEDDGTVIHPTAAVAPADDPHFPGAWFASVTIPNPNGPHDVFVFCAVKVNFERNDDGMPFPSRKHIIRIKVKKAPSP